MPSPRSWGFERDDVSSLTTGSTRTTIVGMKPGLLALLLILGCTDPSTPSAPGGSSGRPPPSGTGNTGGSGPLDGGVDAGTDAGTSRGACDNATDIAEIEAASSIRNTARACGARDSICVPTIGDPERFEGCVTDCVQEAIPGLSPECAACYGGLERCSLEGSCLDSCLIDDTCNPACRGCLAIRGCTQEFATCRGLPGDGCPGTP